MSESGTVSPPTDPRTWSIPDLGRQAPVFIHLADILSDMVDEGCDLVVCTADLKYSNGLARFEDRHPDRFFQFGISEQHMVSAAAGIATVGPEPYVATFASFLALLCCEQIRTDIAYTRQPVRLIGHHAGISLGFYGSSHHATEDLAIMRSIAGMTVVAPADSYSLAAAVRAVYRYPGPVYLRLGRGREPDVYEEGDEFEVGRAITHFRGKDLTIIATGSMVHPAREAVRDLRQNGHDVGLLDMHTLKPLDVEAVREAAERSRLLMTVEEHNTVGGLGGAVSEVVASEGLGVRVHRHGLQDLYSLIGPPTHLYSHYRLDAAGIAEEARAFLDRTRDLDQLTQQESGGARRP